MSKPLRAGPGAHFRSVAAFLGAFARHAGRGGLAAVALVAAGALLEGASLLLLVPLLGVIVSPDAGGPWLGGAFAMLGAETRLERLAWLVAGFLLVMALRATVLFARDLRLARLQAGFITAERNGVIAALAAAPWHRVVGLDHARVTNVMGTEIQRIAAAVNFAVQGSVALALLLIQLATACAIAPGLAMTAALLMAVGFGVLVATQGKARDLGSGVLEASRALIGSATGLLGGLKAAAAQGAQASFATEFAAIQRRLSDRQLAFARRQAGSRLMFGLASALLGAAVVLIGAGAMEVRPAALIAMIVIFARMSGPATLVMQTAQQLAFVLPSFEAIRAIEADLRDEAAPHDTEAVPPPEGPIELSAASYRHPGGGGIAEASLVLAPGSFTGIAGPSGSGKTTLVDLVTGLLVPQSGVLRVGGAPLDAARLAGWHRALAYVPQDGFLFHDTVRRNLSWGNPPLDEAAIARVLALVGAEALVARLPEGLETLVGERGGLLSGGERQRLAIARALLRAPRLLVLDEATNALDLESEAALLDRLAELEPRPAILLVSHRIESLRRCDRVVRVEAGRLVEA